MESFVYNNIFDTKGIEYIIIIFFLLVLIPFWFFVNNDISDRKKSNRIDFLFDLIKEKPKKSNNKLYSYHHYLKEYKKIEDRDNGNKQGSRILEVNGTPSGKGIFDAWGINTAEYILEYLQNTL